VAIAGIVAAATVLACVPTTIATTLLLADTWTRPTYAHLDLAPDRVPNFHVLLPGRGPRQTVLTYEDWSSLAWYQTGDPVVGLLPAGFAKLAFDPAIFSGRSQDQRRADLLRAFDGAPSDLAAIASLGQARAIVLARRGDRLGLLDAAAAVAASGPGLRTGQATVAEGNGWDGLSMATGASFDLPSLPEGAIDLEIRVLAATPSDGTPGPRQMTVSVVDPAGTQRASASVGIPQPGADPWQIAHVPVATMSGDTIRIQAVDPVTVQSVRGFMPAGPIAIGASPVPGWRIATVAPDAVVLEPNP